MNTYLSNLAKLALGRRLLDPLVAVYYVTTQCNLNCAYCEDFGARRNAKALTPLPLPQAQELLRVIRSGVDSLWLTGGEPLLVPHLPALLEFARRELKFRHITLITNGTLLAGREEILPFVNRLLISLDALDPQIATRLNMPVGYLASLLPTIEKMAALQKSLGFRLILNAVITPDGLDGLEELLKFCVELDVGISFSPQAVNNWPRYELLSSPAYHHFLAKLLTLKREGAPILGSDTYLKTLLDNQPYRCYPTLAPRIFPNGDLAYPCRPMEKAGGEHGGRPVNLLTVPDWKTAWQRARAAYGDPPENCNSCFQQCYAEPSLMQAHFLEYLLEGNDLATFAPG